MEISEEMFNIKIEEARESGFKNGFWTGFLIGIAFVVIVSITMEILKITG